MHYYQFNIGDYASHTSRLSIIEDLAYRRLLDLYYLTERPFNGCSTDVAREIGLTEYQSEVDYILSKFFVKDGDEWSNKRADKEISLYQSKIDSASKAGKASAKARKHKGSEQAFNDRSTTVQLDSNKRATKQEPLTKNQEPIIKTLDQSDLLFDEFWKSGIRKANKKKAQSLFNNLLKKQGTPHKFTDMLIADIQERLRINQQGFSEMHPTTYLNGERWNDEKVNPNENSQYDIKQPKGTPRSLIQRTTDEAKEIIAGAEIEEACQRAMDSDDSIVSVQVAIE